jgi:hypothetical protein
MFALQGERDSRFVRLWYLETAGWWMVYDRIRLACYHEGTEQLMAQHPVDLLHECIEVPSFNMLVLSHGD